jgi:membrane protein implicated in regulation of membrane protease activity
MEIIIFIAVVVIAALLWNGYVTAKKTDSDHAIDNWQPPKAEDKPWPYGEKVAEGKIHVKVF